MPWRLKSHHDWGWALSYHEAQYYDYTSYGLDGTFVSIGNTSWQTLLHLTLSSADGNVVLSDGYKAGDFDLNGTRDLSDTLAMLKYLVDPDEYNYSGGQTILDHINVSFEENQKTENARGGYPVEYVTSSGGMVHRWSDLGEVTGQTSSNIRASAARDTGFESRHGDPFPKSGTISTADWEGVCPNFVPLDRAKGNRPSSDDWLKRAGWLGAQRLLNKRGYFLWLFKNGGGVHYRGDYQIGSIRYKDLDSERSSGNDYNYWTFASGNEGFEGTVFKSNISFGDALNGIKNGTPTWTSVATATTNEQWNRDASGTGSSSTGLATAPPTWELGQTASSYYLYAETSGTNTNGYIYALKSPMVYLGGQSAAAMQWHEGRYGSNIEESRVYFVTVPLMLDMGTITTSTNTAEQFRWIFGSGHPSNESTSNTTVRGKRGRFVIAYKTGSNYTGDLQLNDFHYNSTSNTSGGTSLNIGATSSGLITEWEQGDILYTLTSSYTATASDIFTKYYDQAGWSQLGTSTTGGTWVRRTNGTNTPSSGTGLSTVGTESNYVYFESSTPGYALKMRLLRSPEFEWDNGSAVYARWRQGNYGASMGVFKMFFLVGDGI